MDESCKGGPSFSRLREKVARGTRDG
jgi:hypothetical protein